MRRDHGSRDRGHDRVVEALYFAARDTPELLAQIIDATHARETYALPNID